MNSVKSRVCLAVFVIAGFASLAAAQSKKLIYFGIGSPDTVWMRDHIDEMEQAPFDGTVFYLTTDAGRSQGVVGDFSWCAFGSRQFAKSEVQGGIDALKATQFHKFTENFVRITMAGSTDLSDKRFTDWFDSFDVILNNMKLAAAAVKEGGAKGIYFDPEAYGGPVWDYKRQRDAQSKSFEEYAAQVRLRGAQVMQAFQSEYPDITIMYAEAYTLPYRDWWPYPYKAGPHGFPADSASLEKLKYVPCGLLPAFLDGMASVAGPNNKLIDGSEGTYTLKTQKEFKEYHSAFTDGVLPIVGIPPQKYHDTFSEAFSTWIDVNWRKPNGWNGADFENNFWQPSDLQAALKNAIDVSDGYVWLYSESLRFWGPGKNVPTAYWKAVENAHAEISADASH